MQLLAPEKAKPEMACSKDETRPALFNPYLEVSKPKKKGEKPTEGTLHACDSYKLISIPVTFEGHEDPTSGPIPKHVFAEARKAKQPIGIKGNEVVVGATKTERGDDVSFPQVDRLMPEEENVSDFRVGINATFLKQTADAMGCESVVLEFVVDRKQMLATLPGGESYLLPGNQQAIRVRPLAHSGGDHTVQGGPLAIIMPIKIGG